ncbi:hypothetical protein HK096_006103, partial [Nowakowskiella sp. JEL0078]
MTVEIDGKSEIVSKPFNKFDWNLYPDEYHAHSLSPNKMTIRKFLNELFRIQAGQINPLHKINPFVLFFLANLDSDLFNIFRIAEQIVKLQNRFNEKLKRNLYTNNPIRLYKNEIQKLRALLKPLDKDMQKEKENLTNAYFSGTRTSLLKDVFKFVDSEITATLSKNKLSRILWIQGVSGVGKSVVAAIIARELDIRDQLGAYYFAKHDDKKRNSGRLLIFTVAFMLAQWNRDFAKLIFDVLEEQRNLEIPVNRLFSMLIQIPLESLTQNQIFKPIAIVVDALDECEKQNHRNEILKIFAEDFINLPPFVKLIITSRPDDDIIKAFKNHTPTIIKSKSFDDIKKKFKDQTSKPEEDIMKSSFEDHSPTNLEPNDEQNLRDLHIYAVNFLHTHISTTECIEYGPEILVQKSEGLFIWLILACTYLYQQIRGQITLQQIKDLPSGGVNGMDKIYEITFQCIFSNIEAEAKVPVAIEVLAFIVISHQRLSSVDIANLLQLNIDDVQLCIRLMLSVLKVDIQDNCIQVFHKSVVDYLIDPMRCNPKFAFFVNTAKSNLMIVTKSLQCLKKDLHLNICKLDPGILHEDIIDFEHCISKIPKHLLYSAMFWVSHALECYSEGDLIISFSIGEVLGTFTTAHLFNWVELLSVCGRLSTIQVQLPQLINLICILSTHMSHTFLSFYSLVEVEEWMREFLTNLNNCKIVVILCSDKALEHIMRADQESDNMLLE